MKMQRLGDVVKNLDSKRIPLNSEERIAKSKKGLYPYIGANNIVGYIDEYIFDEKILCVAEDGGSWGANQQCAVIYEGKTWVNNHAHVLVENGKANLEYIKSYLNYTNLNKYIKGATRGKLNKGVLENILIPLPPLPDQLHIANLLSKAENLIAQRKESIALLDEFLKSIFLEMFGEPVTNSKGWELKTLDEISNVGSSKRVFVEELVESGVPFFRGTEIGQLAEGIKITPTLYIKKEHFEELKSHTGVPVIGDLLMPSICPDGRIFRVFNNESFYFKDGRVLWVKPDQKIVNSFYLHNTLKRLFITNYNKIASGTTFAELKIVALKKIQVPMPPFELQTRFAQIVEKTEALKTQYQQSLLELENLYGSLSQRAFKGELTRSKPVTQ